MRQSGIKVVSIGGGLGAVQIMRGMQRHTDNLTGIIAVTDTGRSTASSASSPKSPPLAISATP